MLTVLLNMLLYVLKLAKSCQYNNVWIEYMNIFYLLVDGGYSGWSDYTTCSTTCGPGTQKRTRECNNPTPIGTGADCSRLGKLFLNSERSEFCIVRLVLWFMVFLAQLKCKHSTRGREILVGRTMGTMALNYTERTIF